VTLSCDFFILNEEILIASRNDLACSSFKAYQKINLFFQAADTIKMECNSRIIRYSKTGKIEKECVVEKQKS